MLLFTKKNIRFQSQPYKSINSVDPDLTMAVDILLDMR